MTAIRRFEQGFQTDFYSLQVWCEKHGYVFARDGSRFVVRRAGAKGKPKRMTWRDAMRAIDAIRVSVGLESMNPEAL